MGWRFRRRIKILPGIHINISKSGISTNIGVKGANVTFTPKGTYVNTGFPGTGLYRRDRIADNNCSSIDSKYETTYIVGQKHKADYEEHPRKGFWGFLKWLFSSKNNNQTNYYEEEVLAEDTTIDIKKKDDDSPKGNTANENNIEPEDNFINNIIGKYETTNEWDSMFDDNSTMVLELYDPKLDLSQYKYPTIDLLEKHDTAGAGVDMEKTRYLGCCTTLRWKSATSRLLLVL